MAKLRMTYKNLKALRKSKEYQALIVDLVSVGVVPKATAEGLLGYNIPANLITDDENSGTDSPIDDSGESGSGGEVPPADPGSESGGEVPPADPGSESGPPKVDNTVTLLYFNDMEEGDNYWETAQYDLTDGSTPEDILAFAQNEFGDDSLNTTFVSEENPEYVEGELPISSKYIHVDPQPTTIEAGQLIEVIYADFNINLEG